MKLMMFILKILMTILYLYTFCVGYTIRLIINPKCKQLPQSRHKCPALLRMCLRPAIHTEQRL